MRVKVGDTVANWVSVYLDGVDVTNHCTEADSVLGYVDSLVVIDGRPIMVDDEPTTARSYGAVEIRLRDDAPDTARHAFEYLRSIDGLTPLARSFAELATYADRLAAGLREFESLALRYGVELDHTDTHKEIQA